MSKHCALNRIYRLIWNDKRGLWIPVAETSQGRGKLRYCLQTLIRCVLIVMLTLQPNLWADSPAPNQLPTNGQIGVGSATISQTDRVMTIDQATSRASINWQTFDVGHAAAVNFKQPDANAVTLNRVLDSNPSQIFGQINAPGQVFLSNPAGVYFSPSASVNVGALVATTHDMSDADLMAGSTEFSRDGATGSVINEGSLNASLGGYIALLAPEVRNAGIIVAHKGTVVLAAGEVITLNFDPSSQLTSIGVSAADIAVLVENRHAVEASAGRIILSAQAVSSLMGGVIKNSGNMVASSLVNKGGRILLDASDSIDNSGTLVASASQNQGGRIEMRTATTAGRGEVLSSGKLDVSGTRGGDVTIIGSHIGMTAGTVDASGTHGGGNIHIGGDWQGAGDTPQATAVYVDQSVTLNASATDSGDGGEIVAWSDIQNAESATRVYGQLFAQGGVNGGDGGRIETSGYWVDVNGITANASAFDGHSGQWLLDPYNLTVTAGVTTATIAAGPPYTFSSGSGATNVRNTDINAQLNTGTNVTLQTTGTAGDGMGNGDITVSAAIAKTAGTDATLLLKAHNDIIVSSTISSTTGKLNVVLNSDSDSTAGGAIVMNAASSIISNGGDITLGGGADPLTGFATGNATNVNGIRMTTATLAAGGGNIVLRGRGYAAATNTNTGIQLNTTSPISTTGAGTITLTGIGGAGTGASATNYGVSVASASTVTGGSSGAVTVNGTGGTGTGNNHYGVVVTGANSKITSTGGAVNVTGTGGGTGVSATNIGVRADTGGVISAAGTGAVSVTGIGGSSTGTNNYGVNVTGANARINSATGTVTVAGTGGANGTNGFGVVISTSAAISSTNAAINLITNSYSGDATATMSAGTGTLTIQNASAGTLLNLGAADVLSGSLALGLTDAEIDRITTGKLVIGSANAGAATISANMTPALTANLSLHSGGNIAINGTLTVTGNLTLNTTAAVTQTQRITAPGLELLGVGGNYTLTNTANAITTLAGNTGTLSWLENSGFAIGTVNTVGLTTSATTRLSSTGTVTQSQKMVASGLELLGTAGIFTLNTNTGNDISTLAANTGTVRWLDNSGFDVGTVNTVGVTTTGNTTLSSTGAVTQSQRIAAAGLELLGTGGTHTLTNTANAITTLAGNTGSISLLDNTGFAIGTVNTVGLTTSGNTTLSSTGTVTQSQKLAASGLELLGAAGIFTLNTNTANDISTLAANTATVRWLDNTGFDIGTVNTVGVTTTGNTTLNSTGTVTQTQRIAAAGLELLGTAGSYVLTNAANAITTLAGNTGAVSWLENSGFAIGTVNTVGVTTTGNTTLSSTGAVTQSQRIAAAGLELLGTAGSYVLTNTANAITTLAGNTGTLSWLENSGFAIGTVNTLGLTTSGNTRLSSTGTVTQSQKMVASELELLGTAGIFTLNTNTGNDITTLAANTGTVRWLDNSGFAVGTVTTVGVTTTGNTTLSSTGAVTQSQRISAVGLELLGTGGTHTLTNTANAITTLAGNTGSISLLDNTGFAIGTVNTVGLTTSGNTTLSSTGTVTHKEKLAASGLELLGAAGIFTLNTNTANDISTLAANTATVRWLDNTGFDIGTVNTVGVTTTGNTTLNSTGTVTQTQRIAAAGLELLGTAGSYVLTNAANAITTLAGNTGAVSWLENSGFAIGTVNTVGVTTTGNTTLSSTGAVTQAQRIASAGLELLGTAGNYVLTNTANAITTLAGNTGTLSWLENSGFAIGTVNTAGLTTTSTTRLSSTGTVTQTDLLAASGLELLGVAGIYNLNTAIGNNISTLAANTGTVRWLDNSGFAVGTVTTVGVTTTGNTTLSSTGAVTQSQRISAAGLELLGAGGNYTLTNTANAITTLAGNTGTVNWLENSGFAIGTVNTLGLTTSGNTRLSSTGTVTQSQQLVAAGLELAGVAGIYTLTNLTNDVGALAASGIASLNFLDSNALTIGSVGATNGISATGVVTVATDSGDLTIANNVATTNTSASAITLNAGKSTAAGTASGGNIMISGSPSITTGAGGRATLMSGSISDSAGLTTLVGSGSGKFRYNSDESTTNYSTGLGAGRFAIYREQPIISITANNDSKTYDALAYSGGNGIVNSGFVNGDTSAVLSGTLAYGGTAQGAINAGSYDITPSGYSNGLGYALSFVNGTLTVNQAALTVSSSNVTKTYDGTTAAAGTALITSGTLFGSDTLSGGSFSFSDKNVGLGNKTVNVAGITVNDGNSGLNYAITQADNLTSTINQAVLTVSSSDVTKIYDATTTAVGIATVTSGSLFGSDALTGGSFNFTDKNVGLGNKTVNVAGISVNDGNSGLNYAITQADNLTSTINQAALTVSSSDVTKTYDATTTAAGIATVTGGTLFGSDTLSGGSFSFSDKNAGIGNKIVNVAGIAVNDGNSGLNYAITQANNLTSTINQAALTVSTSDVIKTYDGTTTAAGTVVITRGTLFGSDALSGGNFNFANKNASADNKVVNVTDVSVNDGNSGLNYSITQADNITSTINQAALTVIAPEVIKTYDSTTSATGTASVGQLAGAIAGDFISTAANLLFTNANASTGNKTVFANGLIISDSSGVNVTGNYAISYINNIISTINPAPLTITANNDSKIVSQKDPQGYRGVSYSGFAGNETAQVLSGALDISRTNSTINTIGTYVDVLTPSGLTSTNYAISYANGDFTILPQNQTYVVLPPNLPTTQVSSWSANNLTLPAILLPIQTTVNVMTLTVPRPTVSGQVRVDVGAESLSSFDFSLPPDVVRALAAHIQAPQATLLDKKNLPTWLRFDPLTFAFVATAAPLDELPLKLLVKTGSLVVSVEIDAI